MFHRVQIGKEGEGMEGKGGEGKGKGKGKTDVMARYYSVYNMVRTHIATL